MLLLGLLSELAVGQPTAPSSQEALAERLRSSARDERMAAYSQIRSMEPADVGPALRRALIEEVERTNGLVQEARRTGTAVEVFESPEYISDLQRTVVNLRDPDTIPTLARGLGYGNIIHQLVDFFGQQAAPAVLDVVTDPESAESAVVDGLIVLRMLVETEGPLPAQTMARIREAAEQRLTGRQSFLTLTRAIDLAAVLDDPGLRQILQRLADSAEEVRARGITTPDLVERARQHARDRLAGVPPRPRHDAGRQRRRVARTLRARDHGSE